MSVTYKAVAKKNPAKQTDPPKFHAQAVNSGSISLRQLAKLITEKSTVKSADTMAVLEGLLEVIPTELANGKIVRLGDFGSFSLGIKSEGVESEDKLTNKHINKTSIRFRPGTEFQNVIKTITFTRI
ncbi:MAG TPA: DNA-binding domain-containing protein [Bacteroidales bacterium]|nr:DNA-binding domain-containing protein [Bacteroidales bacterium]